MQIQPLHFFSFNRRGGSALVGTLVMVGILALAVGVMISSSNRSIRGSRDKILYEEAYQAALSGTHVTRAWMIDPALAGEMTGDAVLEDSIKDLVWRGLQMNDQILFDRARNDTTNLQGTTERFTAKPAYFTLGETLDGGRRVLYDFPQDSPIVTFINDKENKSFANNLFHGTPAKGHRNYVERIRITTPPMDNASSVSLLECTFVIESHGVAEYAGIKKERIVHQRVLVYPKRPGGALMSSGESILTKQGMYITGKSHANVHWAPVLAKGNIALEFLNGLKKNVAADKTVTWELSTNSGTGKKFNGAGVHTTDPNFDATAVMDKWLHWKTGSNGQITGPDTLNIFSNIVPPADANGNPIPVKDFFSQVKAGTFNDPVNQLNANNLTLSGQYAVSLTTMQTPNGLFTEKDGVTTGGLTQSSAEVDAQVDNFFSTMNYRELKEYAKTHDGYYYYDGTTLYDSTGRVATMPDMVDQVPSGTDPALSTAAQDRILFVDSAADKDSIDATSPFTGKLTMPNFWKGVMYVNGSVQSSGTGASPNLRVRTPDQFKQLRETGSSTTHLVKNVLVDGILICNGIADLGGNTSIYGTLGAHDGVGLGGTPSVFFNSANGEGRMKGDQSMSAEFRLIAGKMYEK